MANTGQTNQDCKYFHLDTSIQVERQKAPRKACPVENILKQSKFKSTSTYAWLEFKRAWIQRLEYLYRQTFAVENDHHLSGHLSDKLGAHHLQRRRLSTCLQALESFLGRIGPVALTPRARLTRLRGHLKNGIIGSDMWWRERSVDHEFDGTGCVRAKDREVRRQGENFDVAIPVCKPGKISCLIEDFFVNNQEAFLAIKAQIDSTDQASSELQNTSKFIDMAVDDPSVLCDSKVCSKISDAIIAVDGIRMDCFVANNPREWEIIAEALDKKLVNPVKR